MPAKFEAGSLAALVAAGGLEQLQEAVSLSTKQGNNRAVLSITTAQSWIPTDTKIDTEMSAEDMAKWVQELAHKTWLALKPQTKQDADAYPYLPPGSFDNAV